MFFALQHSACNAILLRDKWHCSQEVLLYIQADRSLQEARASLAAEQNSRQTLEEGFTTRLEQAQAALSTEQAAHEAAKQDLTQQLQASEAALDAEKESRHTLEQDLTAQLDKSHAGELLSALLMCRSPSYEWRSTQQKIQKLTNSFPLRSVGKAKILRTVDLNTWKIC